MQRICAWCKKDLGTIYSDHHSDSVISHGICDECKDSFFGSTKLSLMEYLDSLGAPVLVIDADGNAQTANKQAREIIQKELPDIEGFKGGDVFECAYAKLVGGCGKTVHCDTCTIRNTVMDTMLTGKSHLRSPAYLNQGTTDKHKEIKFLISTEKVADVVLLRIDKVGEH